MCLNLRTLWSTSTDPEEKAKAEKRHQRKMSRSFKNFFCSYCKEWPYGEEATCTKAEKEEHRAQCLPYLKFKKLSDEACSARVIKKVKVKRKRKKRKSMTQARRPNPRVRKRMKVS